MQKYTNFSQFLYIRIFFKSSFEPSMRKESMQEEVDTTGEHQRGKDKTKDAKYKKWISKYTF